MWISKCTLLIFFLQIFLRDKTSIVTLSPKVCRALIWKDLLFSILNYRQYPHIYFRMTVMRKLKAGEERQSPSSISLGHTVLFIHYFLYYFSCVTVNFWIFISHHDFLKTNKRAVVDNKSQTKKLYWKAGHQRHETTPWLSCEILLEVYHVFLLFSQQKYLTICQHRSYHFLKELSWYATDKNIQSVKCNMGKELSN